MKFKRFKTTEIKNGFTATPENCNRLKGLLADSSKGFTFYKLTLGHIWRMVYTSALYPDGFGPAKAEKVLEQMLDTVSWTVYVEGKKHLLSTNDRKHSHWNSNYFIREIDGQEGKRFTKTELLNLNDSKDKHRINELLVCLLNKEETSLKSVSLKDMWSAMANCNEYGSPRSEGFLRMMFEEVGNRVLFNGNEYEIVFREKARIRWTSKYRFKVIPKTREV
ncbi:MAG: hypothetical protein IBX57_00725 [Gammaproteobacteria bacterium]|nr:hypothetical protein [Gammaproteobacteria bacterium]